jgi:hypothetical protein
VAAAARVSSIAARACAAACRATDTTTVHTVEIAVGPVISPGCARRTRSRCMAAAARVSRIAARACTAARRAANSTTVHTVEVAITTVMCGNA